MLALFVFGISSVFGFKMELTPDLEMPMLFVMTIYQGGDPATTEELVTKIIEDAGKTLSGVDTVTSQTTENMSIVMFSYEYGTDVDEAYATCEVLWTRHPCSCLMMPMIRLSSRWT